MVLFHYVFFMCDSYFCLTLFRIESDEFDVNRLATAPRPGTTLRSEISTAAASYQLIANRPKTSTGRPLTGMVFMANRISWYFASSA